MAMHWIDWSIVFGLLILLSAAAIFTKRYTRSVADFLAANRCAGRYLTTASAGIVGLGAITIVANFELYYNAGFTAAWWQLMPIVVTTIIFISGWVFYRFRQTRALTLAQFLEMRYSRRFRIFAGIVAWIGGIVNFGIFPAVGARFFIYFCGLPDSFAMYALVMVILLAFTLFFTFLGGQIAVLVTDFIQGTFCSIMFIVIIIGTLSIFSWPQITEALSMAPAKASLLHPFHIQDAKDFNLWYFMIFAYIILINVGIWQGDQAYNASPLNPHEARMGKVLATWRLMAQNFFMMMLPVCAYTLVHHVDFSALSDKVNAVLSGIEYHQIQKQMTTPVSMRFFLPFVLKGGFAAMMLAALISTDDTYIHSWGSIFIQDVVMPFRKRPFAPKQHMFLLRCSIFFVAVFIFVFSLVFRQTEYILMYFWITGVIFIGGAFPAVVGGLYWKRGTTAAAYSAMITGSTLATAGIIIRQIHDRTPFTGIMGYIAKKNAAVLSFYASITAVSVYILVSLLGKKKVFNMDKMLHRGKYAVDEPETVKADAPVRGLRAIIGMGSEFSRWDKALYLATMGWTALLIIIFISGTIYNFKVDVKTQSWITYWRYYIWVLLILSTVTTIWFAIGGLRDLKRMFGLLRTIKRDDLDDGMVADNDNLGEQSKESSK